MITENIEIVNNIVQNILQKYANPNPLKRENKQL